MKKTVFICVVLAGALNFQSCGLDNYDAPDTTLQGALIDSETNEPIQTQYQNGAKIRLYEFYNGKWSPQPNDFFTRQDGTFTNKAIFAGKYRIAVEGPFEEVEEIETELSGIKDLQIKVTPFLRVKGSASADGASITITAKIEQTASLRKIQTLGFYCGVTPYVDKNTFESDRLKKEIDLSGLEDLEIVSRTFTETFEGLESGKTYYVRAGAFAQNASNHFNYCEIIEVKIP
jgi:hypothetical protein